MVNFSQISRMITEKFKGGQKNKPAQDTNQNGFKYKLPENYQFDENAQKAYQALTVEKRPIVFLTGRAGTGKTTFIHYVKQNYTGNSVILTSYGMAALNIGGQTIHSFFKFPIHTFENEDIKPYYNKVIDNLDLIIIDEISIVQSDMLDHVDFALRKWRRSSDPFGGIQLLMVGDCFQLSPWIKYGAEKKRYEHKYRSQMFFDAHVFEQIDVEPINLTIIYRQRDQRFINILNRIRIKYNHEKYIKELNQRCYFDKKNSKNEDHLILTTTNARADTLNAERLNKINSASHVYEAITSGKITKEIQKTIPYELELKIGAQVMVTKNIESAANGTLGIVKKLFDDKVIIEKLDDKQEIECSAEIWEQFSYEWHSSIQRITSQKTGEYRQIPLRLGWAITIHKSQGLTFDSVKIDLTGGAFSPGQTYVALSRCRTLENLTFDKPISLNDIIVDPKIIEFYKQIFNQETIKVAPHSTNNFDSSQTQSNIDTIYINKSDFEEKLKDWYNTSNDFTIGSTTERTPLFVIKHKDNIYKLSPDTKRNGVKLYLDLLEKYHGDLTWSVVANANGRMNKVAFGPDKVVLSGLYLYFVDK